MKEIKRCYRCGKFLPEKSPLTTNREPDIFYCVECYEQEFEEEEYAMGLYDKEN